MALVATAIAFLIVAPIVTPLSIYFWSREEHGTEFHETQLDFGGDRSSITRIQKESEVGESAQCGPGLLRFVVQFY